MQAQTTEALVIESTKRTPYVKLQANGIFIIKGRCYPENSEMFFVELIDWIWKNTGDKVELNLTFEHIDTRSTKNLLKLIKSLTEKRIKHLTIKWNIIDRDEYIEELGILIRDLFPDTEFLLHYTDN